MATVPHASERPVGGGKLESSDVWKDDGGVVIDGRVNDGAFEGICGPFVTMDATVDEFCRHGEVTDFEVFASGAESGV